MPRKSDVQSFVPVVFLPGEEYEVHGTTYRIGYGHKYWLVESIGPNPVKIEVPLFFPFLPGKVNFFEPFNVNFTYGQLLIHLALKQKAGEPIRAGEAPVRCEAVHV